MSNAAHHVAGRQRVQRRELAYTLKSAIASGSKTLASISVVDAKQGFRRVHTKLVRYSCTDWSTGSAAGLPPADELVKPAQILPQRAAHIRGCAHRGRWSSCLCKWLKQRVQVASGLRAGGFSLAQRSRRSIFLASRRRKKRLLTKLTLANQPQTPPRQDSGAAGTIKELRKAP